MNVRLSVVAGPHAGKEYTFDGHDTFLVGRSKDAHFQLSADDPYFSRRHFLVEVNPPRCRLLDLKSRNGVFVNGTKIEIAELKDGDEVKAGHTVFRVAVVRPNPALEATLEQRTPTFHGEVSGGPSEAPQLPGYQIGAELGRGGMGVVYRATRLADGVTVAVKTILPVAGVSRRSVDGFLREANILSRLSHPNVVAFHEAGEAGGHIYLAMEFVDGPSADRVLKDKGPLPIRTAVRLVCQMLVGLQHAHDTGFVHRDIKPANVLIGGPKGGRIAKLADFGLARAFEASKLSGLTMQGDVGGTPAYMAPEQVTHFREVKPAADQYAAAVTLYNLLTGRYAHDLPPGIAAQLIHILTEPPVPIRERRAEVPAGLADAIHKALSRETGDRFADAATFRGSLLPFG